jgi:hypothetical protein
MLAGKFFEFFRIAAQLLNFLLVALNFVGVIIALVFQFFYFVAAFHLTENIVPVEEKKPNAQPHNYQQVFVFQNSGNAVEKLHDSKVEQPSGLFLTVDNLVELLIVFMHVPFGQVRAL